MAKKAFVERGCTISHEGKRFTAGGAIIADCRDGYARGVVYASPKTGSVTDWHGKQLARASFGRPYRGNYCKMQSVTFDYGGAKFVGKWCPDTADMVRVKSTKPVSLIKTIERETR
jgi:hypothetical protein